MGTEYGPCEKPQAWCARCHVGYTFVGSGDWQVSAGTEELLPPPVFCLPVPLPTGGRNCQQFLWILPLNFCAYGSKYGCTVSLLYRILSFFFLMVSLHVRLAVSHLTLRIFYISLYDFFIPFLELYNILLCEYKYLFYFLKCS